ncbi:NAD(P)H:quinone oxidoreductase [Aestuariibacter sp. AA17]|uniref:NAD(P)H:quinone oxidoreductase n=1 Tax=Fluctibacter corallii TaxID=2984329 RepID=A0ABT3A5S1_9ALTE|nr:NAD(P)H:quinone oxidoreductase [Aestuariibacter sp. AA17]MCV2884043.1 NAD(P)H:quinone oxidoreductase [Aestuariibacter sp. AA17]
MTESLASSANVLVLYYSRNGSTKNLAYKIAQGIEKTGAQATIRTVPPVSDNLSTTQSSVPETGDPYVTKHNLMTCSGLALGSPTRFGNMASAMKYFWDSTSDTWLSGHLEGKPACVFTSTGSMHGGQESTLLTMMIPLLHHGMILCGLPYSEPALHTTQSGGSPYGVSHVSGNKEDATLTAEETALAIAQGERLAALSIKLNDK